MIQRKFQSHTHNFIARAAGSPCRSVYFLQHFRDSRMDITMDSPPYRFGAIFTSDLPQLCPPFVSIVIQMYFFASEIVNQ